MSLLVAVLLGVVEGLTEYLPVSSTGHLILVSHFLGAEGEGAKSFNIVIQLGALLAAVIYFRRLLAERIRGLFRRDPLAVRLALALLAGFLPTAIFGLLVGKTVKRLLFGTTPVAWALVGGGVIMIGVEGWIRRRQAARASPSSSTGDGQREADQGLALIGPRQGFLIGLGQCVSLWPGSSRAMCTIVAGQLTGLSTAVAAEFSFLLAIPTLGAATLYELLKGRKELLAEGLGSQLVVGMVVSFLVAWGVIATFLRYLRHRGLAPFGFYRIVLGLAVLAFFTPQVAG